MSVLAWKDVLGVKDIWTTKARICKRCRCNHRRARLSKESVHVLHTVVEHGNIGKLMKRNEIFSQAVEDLE